MIDYSFLRFSTTFAKAKEVNDSPVATHLYKDCIQLLPSENYLQISNTENGIAFDGDFKAELVDCCGNVLVDITEQVGLTEFVDSKGIQQIAFELAYLSQDYGFNTVHLKFSKTTGSDVWYSNGFILTDLYVNETTRFDYKNVKNFNGIEYQRADFMQSIRLRTYFDRIVDETESKEYYQISKQNVISTRALLKKAFVYNFDYIDNFTFERVNLLLNHDIIYIDGVRMTNKTTAKSEERYLDSNLSKSEFNAYRNVDDKYDHVFQLYEPLKLIVKKPEGYYTLAGLPTELRVTFNKTIKVNAGIIKIYDSSDNLIITHNIIPNDNGDDFYEFDITGVITYFETYYVQISPGAFSNGLEVFAGIDNKVEWVFIITMADFDSNDFDNNDFFTD